MSIISLKPFDKYNINRNVQYLTKIKINIEKMKFYPVGNDFYMVFRNMFILFKLDYSKAFTSDTFAVIENDLIIKIDDFNSKIKNNMLILRVGNSIELLYNVTDFELKENDVVLGVFDNVFKQLFNI